jgi:hypothetical protein
VTIYQTTQDQSDPLGIPASPNPREEYQIGFSHGLGRLECNDRCLWNGRLWRNLPVRHGFGKDRLTTRPGGSYRPPLTSGLRPIPAVRMPTGEEVKSVESECGAVTVGRT